MSPAEPDVGTMGIYASSVAAAVADNDAEITLSNRSSQKMIDKTHVTTKPRHWQKFHGGKILHRCFLWGKGRDLLSLKVIIDVQKLVLWKAHVELPIGRQ